jgi:hypothetical protein
MKHDEANVIVDNVFTQEEIDQILHALENKSGSVFVAIHCQTNNFIQLPKNIIDKFTNYARSISGNNNLVLTEYCHNRYENVEQDGKQYKPSLFPHYDETFKEPRFTFDYQLRSNIDWPIVVEPDTELTLKDNQAATFSGTNQIHWRTPTEFKDGDYLEMVFCHFSDPTSGPKTADANEIMDAKAAKYQEWFDQNGGYSNGTYLNGRYVNV